MTNEITCPCGCSMPNGHCIEKSEIGVVVIPIERYRQLEECESKYYSLQGHGVDNWEGWDDAMTDFHNAFEPEDIEIIDEYIKKD